MVSVFERYVAVRGILLALQESLLIALGVICAAKIRFWNDSAGFESHIRFPEFALQILLVVAVFHVSFQYGGLYDLAMSRRRQREWLAFGTCIAAACVFLMLVYFAFPAHLIGPDIFLPSVALISAFVLLSRATLNYVWRFSHIPERVLIFGANELGLIVAGEFRKRRDLPVQMIGFASAVPEASCPGELAGLPVLGTIADIHQIAEQRRISRIVVALEDRRGSLPTEELLKLRLQGIRIDDAHSTIASLSGRVWLRTVRPSWFVFSDGFRRSRFMLGFKRLGDLVLALVMLVLTAPVMLAIAIAIRIDSKGPAIYRQTRVGLGRHFFELLKFRSMRQDAEAKTGACWAQKSDPRVTRVGAILRKYRLDELPQLINILRGEMSIVGPRPERPVFVEQLRKLIPYYDQRHSVRPGLTGWAQVEYQYTDTVDSALCKLEYDLFYLKNMSLMFDSVILLKTVRIVLSGHGSR
jgi:sugar transferase (PEP-CTERM system associated)